MPAEAARPTPLVLVVGVSGSGKTTVARLLADRLGWPHRDADEFHSPANRAKMAAGHPLDDADRAPWLAAIGAWMDQEAGAHRPAVVTCSALKRSYRDRLLRGRPGARLVYLHGTPELVQARLGARHGHFFPPALLDSQFADLQEPGPDEHPVIVEVDQPPRAVAAAALSLLGLSAPSPPSEEAPMSAQTPRSAGPTGEQWELRHGGQRAFVVELGGALRHYEADGVALLDGFAADEPVTSGRGQILVPWPNRVGGGRYHFDGADLQLPLSEPERHNAIHGLLRWTPWRLLAHSGNAVRVGTTLHPQPGYPFLLEVFAEYRLDDDGLEVVVRAVNTGVARAPYGVGQHPYLTVGTGLVDTALLTVPARHRLTADDEGLPTGEVPVAGTEYDFRSARPIGAGALDTAFTGLAREADGRAVVRLAHPAGHRGTDLWLGEGTRYVQVYTGDTLAEPGRRRRGVAVEAMSCPADAFRTGSGLTVLEPGAGHTLRWGLRPWTATG